jgi:hypothetical protein
MASIINPAVKVTLDKERSLLYGAAAFIEFKESTGQDLLKYMRGLSEKFAAARDGEGEANPDFELPLIEFRNVLWAGLVHEDEFLRLNDVSRMMEAFVAGMPKSEPDRPTKAPARNPRKLNGIASGASVAAISS